MESSSQATINRLLTEAAKRTATHLHLVAGAYPALRVDDQLVDLEQEALIEESLIKDLAQDWLEPEMQQVLTEKKEATITKSIAKQLRVRASFFYQKGNVSLEIDIIPYKIPALSTLGLPRVVQALAEKTHGLVVIAGPVGSGRTTTLAALLEEINRVRKINIMTLESPIEYLFTNNQSLVTQREIPRDATSFAEGARFANESDIDVLAISDNAEPDTMKALLEFSNSGRLGFVVMNASSAVQAIEEIISRFSPNEAKRLQLLLAESLQAVVVQRLLPKTGGGTALAVEVLIANDAVHSLITEGKIHQLETVIQSSRDEGMISLDQSLAELVKRGDVLIERAILAVSDQENFRKMATK